MSKDNLEWFDLGRAKAAITSPAVEGCLSASYQELRLRDTKILYLELNHTLTRIFVLIDNHRSPQVR
jgi:hypothetical protein